MEEKRIHFGAPISFREGLARLPDCKNNPPRIIDSSIFWLDNLRRTLGKIIKQNEDGNLPIFRERLFALTKPQLKIFEMFSFKRDNNKQSYARWSMIEPESIWSKVYRSGDDNYREWMIWEMKPQPEGDLVFICIQTNSSFKRSGTKWNYKVGLVKSEELKALLKIIER